MLGLGTDRAVLTGRVRRRLCFAGSYAARPRYPCCVRTTQERDGKTFGPGAHGTAWHGHDRLDFKLRGGGIALARGGKPGPCLSFEHTKGICSANDGLSRGSGSQDTPCPLLAEYSQSSSRF